MNTDTYKDCIQLCKANKHTLTYTFIKTGFYSALNNMILAMAYCMHKKIGFRVYSDDFAYFKGQGWNAVFKTNLPETHYRFFSKFNLSSVTITNSNVKDRMLILGHHMYQLLTGNNLASAAFFESRTYWFSKLKFKIDEIQFEGDLRDLCKLIINQIYLFNDEYQGKINRLKETITLPNKYVGIHIRRGDKILERDFQSIDSYIKVAESKTDIRNAFIMTDDYTIITELKEKYDNWSFYTLTFPYERGFVLKDDMDDPERVDKEFVKVLASIDILSKGELFVGTVSANPGMFLGMCMDRNKVHYIDSEDWIIL